MKTFLAWRNLAQHPGRSLTAGAGVAFALLLIFMQLGFHAGCSENAVLVHHQLDFDLAVVSSQYVHLRRPGWVPRARLEQARTVPGVSSVASLYVSAALYRNPRSGLRWEMLVLGVDPAERPFRAAGLNDQASALTRDDVALIDRESRPEVGPQEAGTVSECNRRRLTLVGQYQMGTGFVSTGSLIVGDKTYLKLIDESARDRIEMGLVRLEPGAPPAEAARRLQAALGNGVRVLTRAEIEAIDENFLVNVKPVGVMFTAGVWLAFIVGAVTLYQILAADAASRLPEYATLKAMGYTDGFVYRVVLQQGLIYVTAGFVPAFGLSFVLYWLLRILAKLPATMTTERVLWVTGLSAAMCAVAGALAVRKLQTADPADLF